MISKTPEPTDNKVSAISIYYNLAVQYKDGNGVPMDYKMAYENFSKAAALGDPQSIYTIWIMIYRRLGFNQNCNNPKMLFNDK